MGNNPTTILDIRQFVSHDNLSRITGAVGSSGNLIVKGLNSEITPPFALSATGTNLVLSIGSYQVINPSTSITHLLAPISAALPNFTSGTITLSTTGVGNATPSVGSAIPLVMTASQFLPIGIAIDSNGNIVLTKGTMSALLSGITLPSLAANDYNVGYFVVRTDSSNNVQNVLGSDIYQWPTAITGNIAALTGDVTASGFGSVAATVAYVGSSSASLIHSAELAANAATSVNTASTIVKRDSSGNFTASTITANLTGNCSGSSGSCTGNAATATSATSATSAASATNFSGSLAGDVTGTQSSTALSTSGVTAGTYSYATITVDSKGRVTAASNGTQPVIYDQAWDPVNNTPAIADGTGTNGAMYRVNTAYTGAISGLADSSMTVFYVGDAVIYSSSLARWQRAPSADGVTSVNNGFGAVTVNAINQLSGDATTSAASGSQSLAVSVIKVNGLAIPTSAALVGTNSSNQFVANTSTIANGTSGNAATATSLQLGAANQIPYQTGAGATSYVAAGTTGQLLVGVTSGAPAWLSPYIKTFNATTDWGSASGGYYTITVTAATHGWGTTPSVWLGIANGAAYDQIFVDRIEIASNGDISFRVPIVNGTIDDRFIGEAIIS
jgi:hypothetical protein